MPGELVHLDAALVHANYAGMSRRELLSRLRIELTDAPMAILARVSWMLANPSACVESVSPSGELATEALDVVLEVVENPRRRSPGLGEQVQELRRDAALPLIRLVKSGRDRLG